MINVGIYLNLIFRSNMSFKRHCSACEGNCKCDEPFTLGCIKKATRSVSPWLVDVGIGVRFEKGGAVFCVRFWWLRKREITSFFLLLSIIIILKGYLVVDSHGKMHVSWSIAYMNMIHGLKMRQRRRCGNSGLGALAIFGKRNLHSPLKNKICEIWKFPLRMKYPHGPHFCATIYAMHD